MKKRLTGLQDSNQDQLVLFNVQMYASSETQGQIVGTRESLNGLLKRAQVPSDDLVAYCCASIRSSLGYACPVFRYALPKYLRAELERLRKRAFSGIFPGVSYKDALILVGIECIKVHQEQNLITKQLLQLVSNNPSKKIYGLLPKKCNGPTYNFRR